MMTEAKPEPAISGEVLDGNRALAVEMDSQRKVALAAPRNERILYDASMAELAMFPEFAEDAYYSIPYSNARGDDNEKTLVEGPSVKASRALARRWGNCATSSRIFAEFPDHIEVEGVFADFETNFITRRLVSVPKTYIPKKTGIPVPLRVDRLNMAVQAGMSKAERNATLSGLPVYLVESYFTKAKQIAGQKGKKEGKTDAQRFEALYAAFEKLGVATDRVKAYIAVKFEKDANIDDTLGTMRGIFNAIKDGQVRAEDAFPAVEKPKAAGAVSGEQLGG